MAAKAPRELVWFRDLVGELAAVPDTAVFYGTHVESLVRRRRTIRAWTPEGAGWYVEVARVGRGATLEVWYDRYLDPHGDPHVGVWIRLSPKRAIELAHRLPEKPKGPYTWDDRDDDGFLRTRAALIERSRIGRYFIDDWDGGSYVGGYVRASPHMRPAEESVGPVVAAMRRLAEAAAPPRERPVGPKRVPSSDRYVEIVKRLARPEQAAFRSELIETHGARCVVSSCAILLALDAAHIAPVQRGGVEHVDNGLLLRSDLHRLFDAGLWTIFPEKSVARIAVAAELEGSEYGRLGGQPVHGLSDGQLSALALRNEDWTPGGLVTRAP